MVLQQAAEFVASAPDTVAATITAHHLLYNRNAIFKVSLASAFVSILRVLRVRCCSL
jgi:dihydroorotase